MALINKRKQRKKERTQDTYNGPEKPNYKIKTNKGYKLTKNLRNIYTNTDGKREVSINIAKSPTSPRQSITNMVLCRIVHYSNLVHQGLFNIIPKHKKDDTP